MQVYVDQAQIVYYEVLFCVHRLLDFFFQDFFEFLSSKFAACLKPPSRDNHRKASYPTTQQCDQGAG